MEFDPSQKKFVATGRERNVLGIEVDSFDEETAVGIMMEANQKMDSLGNALTMSSTEDFQGSRLAARRGEIAYDIGILSGVVECIGAHISHESALQEIEDFANKRDTQG